MKVSVIVPVCNNEKNLAQTLSSLKAQKLKSMEVIIVDDASTDSSAAIAGRFVSTAKNFSLLRLDGRGTAAARNAGIEAAKGKYIAFLNAGDSYTENFLMSMCDTAERYSAELTVGKMRSIDEFGTHKFSSAGALAKRGLTDRYDFDLIWNPSLSNKLFLRSKLAESGLRLSDCGAVQEAVFSLSFAFGSDIIACCPKGSTELAVHVFDEEHAAGLFDFECYLHGYELIRKRAAESFEKSLALAQTDFERSELKRRSSSYTDEVILKELTVLLYRYYRRIHFLKPDETKTVTQAVMRLSAELSENAFKSFITMNSDIFVDGVLADSTAKLMDNPQFTVAVRGISSPGELNSLMATVFRQTMPAFELIIDRALESMIDPVYAGRECIRFIEGSSPADFRNTALEYARAKYIIFIDRACLLDPKALQRNYKVLRYNKQIGFTTTPLARFIDGHVREYRFCSASFLRNPEAISIAGSPLFPFDLFLSNKFFKVSHLKGIKFSFTDNETVDAYTLYRNSFFRKMPRHCVYLTATESSLLASLKESRDLLPPECGELYDREKRLYRRIVSHPDSSISLKLTLAKKRIQYGIISAFYRLFSVLPLKKRVVFYTQNDSEQMGENMRLVFEAVGDIKKTVIAVRPKSHPTLRIMRLLLTSKVIVTDGYMDFLLRYKLRDSQFLLQLWNSAGAFKRFGLDAESRHSRIEEMKLHEQYSAVCVTSPECRQYYSHAFGISRDKILSLGRPDTDLLLSVAGRQALRDKMLKKHPLLKGKRIYLYCPTFREANGRKIRFEPDIDWLSLENSLGDDEIFIIHRHPVMREDLLHGKFYPNVKDYTNEPLNELLSVADVLITDYSSVMFDAVLMDIPIVFYCPDIKNYARDFYLRYPADLPGEAVESFDELLSTVRAAGDGGIDPRAEDFRRRQLSACDGHSTQRVAELIIEKLK